MDFESPTVAQKAVTALKNKGIQAQMAKVHKCGVVLSLSVCFLSFPLPNNDHFCGEESCSDSCCELTLLWQAPLELIDFLSLMNNMALGCHMSKVIDVKFNHDIQ